jgi:hypothetical protein
LNASLKTLELQIYDWGPLLLESEQAIQLFLKSFQSNCFLEKVVMHDMEGGFFHEDHKLQINHYCARNTFIRDVLQQHPLDDGIIHATVGSNDTTSESKLFQSLGDCTTSTSDTQELSDGIWPMVMGCIVKCHARTRTQTLYQVLSRFLMNVTRTTSISKYNNQINKRKITTVV